MAEWPQALLLRLCRHALCGKGVSGGLSTQGKLDGRCRMMCPRVSGLSHCRCATTTCCGWRTYIEIGRAHRSSRKPPRPSVGSRRRERTLEPGPAPCGATAGPAARMHLYVRPSRHMPCLVSVAISVPATDFRCNPVLLLLGTRAFTEDAPRGCRLCAAGVAPFAGLQSAGRHPGPRQKRDWTPVVLSCLRSRPGPSMQGAWVCGLCGRLRPV